jgi:hypothetical protein
MLHNPPSVQLDKSPAGNDEHVPVRVLLNPADGDEWNDGIESLAVKAVKPCTGTDPQGSVAAEVKACDLVAYARTGMIEGR